MDNLAFEMSGYYSKNDCGGKLYFRGILGG